jgi:Fe-S-cluster containining protein
VTEPAFLPIDDVGLRLPKGMPEDIAEPFLEYIVSKAGALRGGAAMIAGPVASAPPLERLRFMLDIAKQHVLPGTDAIVEEFANAPAKIECRAGCSFCCHQNVDVTIPEAILIALRLADPEDPRRSAVLSTAEAFTDLEDDARIATGRPCPLLIDKRCSVYEDRPIACRSLASPDAARCDEAMQNLEAGKSVLPIEIYLVLQFLCNGEQSAMRGICRDNGLQDDIVELTQTVAAILHDESLVERWAKGEHVFTARD